MTLLPPTNPYEREFRIVARQVLSAWNRDPGSPSYGSMDRPYWGWKYKDFSDSTMQYGLNVAIAYARRSGGLDAMRPWLDATVRYMGRIQWGDGSFDQCYPHEKSPGVFFDFLATLVDLHGSGLLSRDAAAELEGIIRRGVAFLLRTDEKHGEVANHIAQYGYELLHYAKAFGDAPAEARGREYIARTLSWFDRDEGWFREYHGPDAGYQTRTLRYLTKTGLLYPDLNLWPVVDKAMEFMDAVVMPDGTINPLLGCRSTALIYPYSFEVAARRDARFAPLAARIQTAWDDGLVPLPSSLDFGNAIRLGDDAREAADLVASQPLAATAQGALPARLDFPNAGIFVRRSASQAVYVGSGLGGAVVIYRRSLEGAWRLAVEDGGYLLAEGGRRYVTRVPAAGMAAAVTDDSITIEAGFFLSLHEDVKTYQMVALRILNSTVLRIQWIGDLFRKVVVRRLMGRRVTKEAKLHRTVTIHDASVTIDDRIAPDPTTEGGRLYRARRASGIHMASSRYFQPVEIEVTQGPWEEPTGAASTRAL
ncbi:MAG: hypothetical protein K1Y01_08460 [Vicinamibacteria bacterium]|nr:hypothetical protein [Vicinamibacteria bacterium]